MEVELYSADQFDEIPWPETEEADLLRRYMAPMVENGTLHFIENADSEVGFVKVGEVVLPFTVASKGGLNSYVVAPKTHYVDYSRDELRHMSSRAMRWLAQVAITPIDLLCRWGRMNRVVMINNWLLSTNLFPPGFDGAKAEAVLAALKERFPDHTLVIRSVDLGLRRALFESLQRIGAKMVMSRRVHLNMRDDRSIWKRNNVKNDGRLQRKTPYEQLQHDEITEAEMPRIKELYDLLYLDKYSRLNPKFTEAMLLHLWRQRLWEFKAWRLNGRIDAVSATIRVGEVRTAPLVGYDTALDRELGLYRLAYLDIIEYGRSGNETIHGSAGVAAYKQGRGAQSFFEYNAVVNDHLSLRRRLPWMLLGWITYRVVGPMMERENL